jgi:putative CocE/NonD family hydrolase
MPTYRFRPATLIAILPFLAPALVEGQTRPDSVYDKTETMIPMRDGVKLHTLIFAPRGRSDTLPILITRTPYGVNGSQTLLSTRYGELARERYVFVFQDIRGRYQSEGEFQMNRPLRTRADTAGVDESTDTYDSIEWLLRHVPRNNGKVGVVGISYPGWLAAMAGINPHPALKAISPQAPMTDTWMGDDFFHYGAFRLSYGFEYSSDLELSKDESVEPPISRYDTYDWYLEQGPLANLTALLGGRVPTWANFAAHPAYDSFWVARALPTYLTRLQVPTLTVGGWWDPEDFYGALKTYATLERLDTGGINYLVMGPWNHGGWSRGDGNTLGNIDFGSATSKYFRERIQAPWFAYWLKGKGTLALEEATVFETGDNRWRSFFNWPPRNAAMRRLYTRAAGKLSFDAPTSDGYDQYISDPAKPVPYRARPIQQTYDNRGSGWYTWLTEDQRFVQGRPDVLTWQTEPLAQEVTIAGDIRAHLFASTTGTDGDWIVKLIDVYPDSIPGNWKMGGYQLMVASEILRGRYRQGFDRPAAISANEVAEYVVDLHQQSYRFQKGHRIMVQVQSTWFPVYDRNPQTYVANIFEARESDFRSATQRIHRSPRQASYVELPVLSE